MSNTTGDNIVLILGANGFIGSHLVDDMAKAGYRVRAYDRYSHPPQFNKSERVEIVVGDFSDDISVGAAMDGVTFLLHCFSVTTPFISDADPYQDITLNVLRSVQLFEKAVERGVKKVVYISSGGAVYGHIAEQKNVAEDDAPMPVSPYGIGKLATEYYLEYFNRKYDMEYIVYRLSNPYGSRQVTKHNQGVIPAFLSKLEQGEKLSVIGDGTSTRDYIYIEDATNMITKTFSQETEHTIYNLGSGVQTSVNEIIKIIEQNLDVYANIENLPAPKTFLSKAQMDVNRFLEEFRMSAPTSIETGIKTLLKK